MTPTSPRTIAVDQGAFNTYGIDWQPGTLTIYLNGNVSLVDHPNPAAPLTSPEPFNDPFFLALTAGARVRYRCLRARHHAASRHHPRRLGAGLDRQHHHLQRHLRRQRLHGRERPGRFQ